jgi:hypothetical protein
MLYEGKDISPVGEYYLHNNVLVLIKDPLPEEINIQYILEYVEKKVPFHLVYEVDSIYIGQFDEFEERQINSFYRDGAIFVTNYQSSKEDLIDDIVHEIAHAVEEQHSVSIYGDRTVEEEFLGKRRRLYDLLIANELISDTGALRKQFATIKYTKRLDDVLYKEIGYPTLSSLTQGLFTNPYAITSLREYFASAFELYFLGEKTYLQKISPKVYYKMNILEEINSEG